MTESDRTSAEILTENEHLKARIKELDEVLWAIRSGEVDAIVSTPDMGGHIFTLESSETPYRFFVENMNQGAVILDSDLTILYCNQKFADMTDQDLNKLVGVSFCNFLGSDDAKLCMTGIILPRSERVSKEIIFTCPGREPIPVQIDIGLLKEEAGYYTYSAILTDLSFLKKNEMILEETLSLLHAAIESTNNGLLVVNTNRKVTISNNLFIEMWNLSDSFIISQDDRLVMNALIRQVKNPEEFAATVHELYATPDKEESDILELLDNRIFEWYSKPQIIGDIIVGRIWSFQDITQRKTMEYVIEKSLAEKEMLLKEIHHRVKNNMQVISSLLFMQARKTKDAGVQEILLESQNRIKSIALVHERMYQSEDFEKIDYNDYIRKFTRHLFESYQVYSTRISLSINKEMVYLPIDKAVPCSLVINELVSNAVKHAFPEGRTGTIFIDFQRQGDTYVLMFRDDGIGMPQGIDNTHYETLGLELIRGLVRQLNGTIELDRTAGAAYTITFPV